MLAEIYDDFEQALRHAGRTGQAERIAAAAAAVRGQQEP
jgi:hypothetical protein